MYFLVADGEPGAEVYSAAADRDQASIIYHEAVHMAEQCPLLYRKLECVRSTKRIVYPGGRAVMRALSADVPTKHGLNASAVLFDELHTQKTRDLWDTLFYAGASRRQPFQCAISTAGFDRESLCYEQHSYAAGVLDGTVADWTYFALLYGADDDDDWTLEATWKKANPSYGITMDPVAFAADCREAQASLPRQNSFRRLRLDQWTEQDERWLDVTAWDACGPLPADLTLEGRSCFGGLDLASTTDIAALVLAFPIDDLVVLLEFFWVPQNNVKKRASRDRVPYDEWVALGELTATPGDVIDYDWIRRDINALYERFQIREIAIDRWNATHLAVQLEHDGLAMVKFGQGFASMCAPTKKLDELVVSGKLRHNGGRVLRWMAKNVALEKDAADNWKPSKKRSPEKIDGIVAAIMAIDRATTQPAESVYESRGVLEL